MDSDDCRLVEVDRGGGASVVARQGRIEADDLLAKGVGANIVAELMGHRGTKMLERHYAHLTQRVATLREALGRR